MLLLCTVVSATFAQRITHEFNDASLSDALKYIQQQTTRYDITFTYDELEDFRVTTDVKNKSVTDALLLVVGFYPIRITRSGECEIYVECTHKTERHLTGNLIDEQGQPVAYANIAVLNPADSTLLSGGVSNEAGRFVVPYEQPTILARISFIGYKTVYRLCSHEDMGTIRLQRDSYVVKGVEVRGSVPQFKATNGGMTVKVQNSILHDIGTTSELLSMIPLVQGRDGKFEVLGKGEPEIYINNKKVRDASELKQLKSTDIKSVDVITAPGAKYNAEVSAVIRIKTIKTQGDGFSLMATSQTWKNNKWNNYDDLTLKYRTGGLEAFANNVVLDNEHYSNDQHIDQELHISKDMFNAHVDAPVRSRWTEMLYKAGLSYDFNADHSIGLSFSSQKQFYQHTYVDMTQNYQKNGGYYGDIQLIMDASMQDKPVWELNAYYVGKVGKLGIDLNATVLRRESEDHLYEQEFSKDLGDRTITIQNNDDRRMAAGKLVQTYPVWKGELSAGSETTSTKSLGSNYNDEGIIPASDNEMDEKNIAGFAEYALQLGAWRLDAGLRFEHVSADYSSFGTWQDEPSRNYNDWFPNLSGAWQKGKWSVQLAYSKRITRPPYQFLSSAVEYDSRMFYQGGNPLLRPSVRQSIDLNLVYSWLTFVTGFTREKDIFTHLAQVYDEEKEIAIFRPYNFDHQYRVYATLVASPKLGFWQPTATLHYYQQMFDAEKYGAPKKLDKPEFSFDLKSWFVINPTTKALVQASYTGSNHWGFMYRGSNFYVNARLQKAFWQGRLTGTLYANDIFDTMRNKVTTYYAIGQTAQNDYGYKQSVGLTLSYNFNITRSKYKGTGAGNAEKNRL